MSEARNLKAREYNTNIYGHDQPTAPPTPGSIRATNTWKSNAFNTEVDPK
jgi:hypothetical protein